MRYIIRKGTPLFDKLKEVHIQMQVAHKACVRLIEEVNVGDSWRGKEDPNVLSGGITSFEIRKGTKEPTNWKKKVGNESFPKKCEENEELLKTIDALPVVRRKELNDLINYDWRKHCEGRHISFGPGWKIADDYILIGFSDSVDPDKYNPVDGMEEITVSEYQRLYKSK